jgi:hypothetical protein
MKTILSNNVASAVVAALLFLPAAALAQTSLTMLGLRRRRRELAGAPAQRYLPCQYGQK